MAKVSKKAALKVIAIILFALSATFGTAFEIAEGLDSVSSAQQSVRYADECRYDSNREPPGKQHHQSSRCCSPTCNSLAILTTAIQVRIPQAPEARASQRQISLASLSPSGILRPPKA